MVFVCAIGSKNQDDIQNWTTMVGTAITEQGSGIETTFRREFSCASILRYLNSVQPFIYTSISLKFKVVFSLLQAILSGMMWFPTGHLFSLSSTGQNPQLSKYIYRVIDTRTLFWNTFLGTNKCLYYTLYVFKYFRSTKTSPLCTHNRP